MKRKLVTTDRDLLALRESLIIDEPVIVLRGALRDDTTDEDPDVRSIPFVLSTPGRKGDGLKLDPQGWDFERFEKNPVMLDHHMSWRAPIGRWDNVRVDDDGVMRGDAIFAPADLNASAEMFYRLYQGRFMNAVSIGFCMRKWAFVDPKDPYGPIDSSEQELYEASAVTLPMDPDAVQEAARADDLGELRESAIRILDVVRDDPHVQAFATRVFEATRKSTIHPVPDLSELDARVRALEHSTADVVRIIL